MSEQCSLNLAMEEASGKNATVLQLEGYESITNKPLLTKLKSQDLTRDKNGEEDEYIDCAVPDEETESTFEHYQFDNQADNTYADLHISLSKNDFHGVKDSTQNVSNTKKIKQSVWNTPFITLTVLLCLILVLLVTVLSVLSIILAHMFMRDATCTSTATGIATGNIGSPNFTEWANNLVYPNFTEWANNVAYKVSTNVSQSFPGWANVVALNTFQLLQDNFNFTAPDELFLQIVRDSAQKLTNIVNSLSVLQDTSTSTAGVADDILLVAQELLVLHNDSTALPTSCEMIKQRQPNSPSGVYILAQANRAGTYSTYCNMGTLCGSGGGWTRLAYLDMSDASQNCPSGFRLYQSGGVRACGRPVTSSGSCASIQFPSNDISYSQLCGRVVGYQYNSPDAVNSRSGNLNGEYVDGVCITRGSPRQHVWTLMAGVSELVSPLDACPCSAGSTVQVESFIGSHYYCESGNPAAAAASVLYTSDPLWDGQGCHSNETACCTAPGLPWFHRDYGSTTTTDYLELRVCADEGTNNEDIPIGYYEFYVK